MVTSNGAFDPVTGNHGGVYLLSLARLNSFYLGGTGYVGWSNPVCQGARLPGGTAARFIRHHRVDSEIASHAA
jgi:hypothetical protein